MARAVFIEEINVYVLLYTTSVKCESVMRAQKFATAVLWE